MNKINLLISDFDGTLVDTFMPIWLRIKKHLKNVDISCQQNNTRHVLASDLTNSWTACKFMTMRLAKNKRNKK